MSDWGSSGIDSFISPLHSSIYPSIDPSNVSLPPNYTVCILGGSGVIGAGIAHAYATAGASRIILASRRVAELEKVATECKHLNNASKSGESVQVDVVKCDITSTTDFENLVKVIKESNNTHTRLDAVIINSGHSGPVILSVTENDMATVKKLAQLKLIEHIHEQFHAPRLPSGDAVQLLAVAVHPGAVRTETALQTAPDAFMEFLTEEPGLVGGVLMWLGGRHLVAKWDVDALVARKEEIVARDLLKLRLAL
ncbi:hypothetical protein BDV97DRAFT_378770 [Delphinella strobiligena]|nr:hypothetical protein BDV97DRAFT_378770 [Delphinella strobiligena]